MSLLFAQAFVQPLERLFLSSRKLRQIFLWSIALKCLQFHRFPQEILVSYNISKTAIATNIMKIATYHIYSFGGAGYEKMKERKQDLI